MELIAINKASNAPDALQRAAKCALVVGAQVHVNSERDALFVKFDNGDHYYFDPDDATLHALEMLGQARAKGFVGFDPVGNVPYRARYVVRVVFSDRDVRVQIGASRWYADKTHNAAVAMRSALVDAFCAYYDDVYTET